MCADLVGELATSATAVKHSLVVEKIILRILDVATGTTKLSKREKDMLFESMLFPEFTSVEHVTGMADNAPKHKRKYFLALIRNSLDSLSLIEDRERFVSLWLEEFPKPVQKAIRAYIKYREMVVMRQDLVPQVLKSKFSVFP